jgi:Protein of unknown function (DUF998)
VDFVRGVPWWGLVSSATTPVLLVAGWTIAADLQPVPYDPVAQSVSALAAIGATDRWVMSAAFVVVATGYVITGIALRPASRAGRVILVASGAVGVMIALSPEPGPDGFSLAHAVWATAGFALLAAWPLAAIRNAPDAPWGLRPAFALSAVALSVGLCGWFVLELLTGGSQIGLSERVLGEVQSLWPLLAVLSCRRASLGDMPETLVRQRILH